VDEGKSVNITLKASDPDGDSLTYMVVTPPEHGTLTGTAPILSYLAVPNYTGPDSFIFKVNDSRLDSATAMVNLNVLPVNNPPVAVGKVTPQFQISTNDTGLVVLSPNNTNAAVIFDGSLSSDVENESLRYLWFEAGSTNAFGISVMVTNVLGVGTHQIFLLVSDGAAVSTNSLTVEVITAAQAVAEVLLLMNETGIGQKHKRPLIATLYSALGSFDRGEFDAGINQLGAFQNKVLAQLNPSAPAIARIFGEAAQAIIDGLSVVETGSSASGDEHREMGHATSLMPLPK
jgi:hypothetical protein